MFIIRNIVITGTPVITATRTIPTIDGITIIGLIGTEEAPT
jgi:hypothetical protein